MRVRPSWGPWSNWMGSEKIFTIIRHSFYAYELGPHNICPGAKVVPLKKISVIHFVSLSVINISAVWIKHKIQVSAYSFNLKTFFLVWRLIICITVHVCPFVAVLWTIVSSLEQEWENSLA